MLVVADEKVLGAGCRVVAAAGKRRFNVHHALRLRVRKRPQQDAVDEAEYRGIRADAERQSQHGNSAEARILANEPQGVTKILRNGPHHQPWSERRSLDGASLPIS